jgi:endogenous inhibitor of DNA gyrase (YacG/DUF329 family)
MKHKHNWLFLAEERGALNITENVKVFCAECGLIDWIKAKYPKNSLSWAIMNRKCIYCKKRDADNPTFPFFCSMKCHAYHDADKEGI